MLGVQHNARRRDASLSLFMEHAGQESFARGRLRLVLRNAGAKVDRFHRRRKLLDSQYRRALLLERQPLHGSVRVDACQCSA